MNFIIVWFLGILLLEHISIITSSLSLKYQKCMSEKINGYHLYTGTQSYTKSRHQCERWDALNPIHPISSEILATNRTHRSLQKNYCRTMYPDRHPFPWCYTTNKDKEWEECGIPECYFDTENDKYKSCTGKKINGYYPYNGIKSVTKSGFTCQRWDSINPHPVTDNIVTLGRTFLSSQNNYCRTMYPDPNQKPWCYTMNTTKLSEECDIPICYTDNDTVLISRFKPFSLKISYENTNYSNGVDDKNEAKFKTLLKHYNKWEVNLLRMSKIRHVILSSVDIKAYFDEHIRKIDIHIGDEKYNNWEKCADFDGLGKNVLHKHKFVCEGVAQYIRVEIYHFGHIRFQGVDVFGYQYGDSLFLLLNKSALFISTSNDKESSPGVVGLIDTKFKPLLSWIHFWKVNLLKQYTVRYVILHNTYIGQQYSDDIFKIAVYIENKEQQNSARCAYFEAAKEESRNMYRFICEGIGQYIRVEKSKFGRFQLQEVEVFGYTYDEDIVLLSDNKKYIYFNTSLRQNYIWQVNLLRMCKIMYVLAPSIGNFQNIAMYIGGHEHNNWDKCAVFESSAQNTKDTNFTKKHRFDCEGIGQYIRVEIVPFGHSKTPELKVFGIQWDDDIILLYNKSALFVAEYGNKMSSPGTEPSSNTNFETRLSWKNFWKVNLLKVFKIKYVILHNVYPVTQSANSNLTIAVYLENSKQKYSIRCAYYHGPGDKSRTLYRFICEAIGQYIRVENSQFGRFKLQEIEVYGYLYYDDAFSISQGKPTLMSSTYENEYSSQYGVDGKRSTKFKTSPSQYNNWEVNLLRMYKIRFVILTNVNTYENDFGSFRNIGVYFEGKEHYIWEICSYFKDPREISKKYYATCEGIAQYIRVHKSYFGSLQLQEVEVFGITIDDVILLSSNKPTWVGHRIVNDISVHGVDGDINTFFKMGSSEHINFWAVNLLKMLKIKYVTIYAGFTKEYDFNDFQKISIYVANKSDSLGVKCAYYDGPEKKSRTTYRLMCEAIGKYVRIDKNHDGHIKLHEVEIYGINDDAALISLRKGASRTLFHIYEKQYPASHGIDGKKDTKFKTSWGPTHEWEVHFGRMCKISHVILTNVDIDGDDPDGFRKISVYLVDKNRRNRQKCGYFEGPGENSVNYSTTCEGIAEHIRVEKNHVGHFQLQEVEVFGYYIDDIILIPTYNTLTFMSSTFENDISSHGVDGQSKTKFKTLYHDHSSYWAINLSEMWNISYVSLHVIYQRVLTEYFVLRNISIYISDKKENFNERCAYFGGPDDPIRTIYYLICEGIGQFVRIVRDCKGHLELQEVKLHGKKPTI